MADIYSSTGNLNDIYLAAAIETNVLSALQEIPKVAPWVKNYDCSGCGSNVYQIPIWGTFSASTIGETADLTSTAFTDTKASITAGEVGVMTIVPDKLMEVKAVGDIAPAISREMALAIGRSYDSSITALFPALNGGTKIGTSGSAMSVNIFLRAIYTNELNNVNGDLVAFMHPLQVNSLRVAVAASTAIPQGWKDVFYAGKARPDGFISNFYGVDLYQTTLCPTSDGATANRNGAMMGMGDESAIALGIWRPIRVETQRDASRRALEVVGTSLYGAIELRDKGGVCVLAK